MAYRIPQSSAFTVPFWLVTSDGTTPDTGASNDSIILYAGGSNASFVPDVLVTAVHAAAGQYKVVLSTSNTSQLGALWGYHAQGSFQMPIFAAYVEAGSVSTFAASTDSVGLKGVNHPGATIPTVTTLTGHTAQTGDAYGIVNSGTHGNAALKTLIDAVDDFLDTEIAAILEDTGTTLDDFLDTEIAAILADTNELQTDLVNGGRLDLLIDAIKAKTDSLTFTTANQVDANIQSINDTALTGNGQSGTEWGPA
jgi:hypothetical protein